MSNKVKLKTKPLDAKGQARLMGRLKADPAMILREHTINGVEAIERNTSELMASGVTKDDPLLLPETYVEIRRDSVYREKAVFVDAGGDFITKQTAEDHLAALGQSGNAASSHKGQGLDANIGVGAKIATFALFKTIVYRSKEAGVVGGKKYTLTYKNDELDTVMEDCPQKEFCMLGVKDSGTEVVLWGNNKKHDTWDDLNRIYISTRSKAVRARDGQTGNALRKWLSNRFAGRFTDAWGREIPIRVADYRKGTRTRKTTHNIWYAGEEIKNDKWGETTDSTEFVWDGSKVKMNILVIPKDDKKKKQSNFRTTGGVSLVYKNEVYEPRLLSDHKAADALLTKAGLGMLPGELKNKVWFQIEFDDNAPFEPAFDRAGLVHKDGTKLDFDDVAEKIAAQLGKLKKFSKWVKKNVEMTDKSLEEQVHEAFQNQIDGMKQFKGLFGGFGGRSVKGSGPGKGKGGGKPSTKGPLGNGGQAGIFNIEVVPNKDAELIELQIRNIDGKSTYCLTYNTLHKLHTGNYSILKAMLLADDEIEASAFNSSKVREWVDNALALKSFVSAFATVLERKVFYKETSAELIKALTPQRLESGFTPEAKKMVFKSLKSQIGDWSKMKKMAA